VGQLGRDQRLTLGIEPVTPPTERDVEVAVGVGGDATRPERTAGEIRGASNHLQRFPVDAFEPRRRVGIERATHRVHLTGIAQHDHPPERNGACGRRLECTASIQAPAPSGVADEPGRLTSRGTAVLTRPWAPRPVTGQLTLPLWLVLVMHRPCLLVCAGLRCRR
jgi:hypothetical protein